MSAADLLKLLDDIESHDLSEAPYYVPMLVRELRAIIAKRDRAIAKAEGGR